MSGINSQNSNELNKLQEIKFRLEKAYRKVYMFLETDKEKIKSALKISNWNILGLLSTFSKDQQIEAAREKVVDIVNYIKIFEEYHNEIIALRLGERDEYKNQIIDLNWYLKEKDDINLDLELQVRNFWELLKIQSQEIVANINSLNLNDEFKEIIKSKDEMINSLNKLVKWLLLQKDSLYKKTYKLSDDKKKLKEDLELSKIYENYAKSNNINKLKEDLENLLNKYNQLKEYKKEIEKQNETLMVENKSLKETFLQHDKISQAFWSIDEATKKIDSYLNPGKDEELLRLRKDKKELEDKLAEIERKEKNEETSIDQLNKEHRDDLRKINSLKTENQQLVKIIELLSEDSNISLEDLKLFLKIEHIPRGNKIFTKVEIMQKIKTYKQNQHQK